MTRGVPVGPTPTHASHVTLPADLLDDARRRARRLALVFVVLSAVALALAIGNLARGDVIGTETGARIGVGLHGLLLAFDIALFLVARSGRVDDRTALHFALVWEVAMCAALSIGEPWISYEERGMVPSVTWASLVIVSVPLIIPLPPQRMLLTSIAAASTVPLGLLALHQLDAIVVGRTEAVGAMVSPVFSVALAYFGARAMYGMSRDVAEARRLGAYELESLIGRGGMGEVWRARHRMLARPAAVKLIRHDLSKGSGTEGATSSAVRRFEREAHVTAQLRSPHTVELYDFGLSADGQLYYVMELLDGIDLETLVRNHGPQPPDRVVGLLRQVCDSLDEAHATGLVHRDIKPANIYVCRYGRQLDFVKVLDFGLVALQPALAPEQSHLTAEGKIHGTPAYMPPEFASTPDAVDHRADIYAVGCVGFWLLTGRLLFPGSSPVEMIADHLKTAAPSPSSITSQTIPKVLDDLILACLAKDPNDRPASAAALGDALDHVPTNGDWNRSLERQWWMSHLPGAVEADVGETRSIEAQA